jgi:hypothetical protein
LSDYDRRRLWDHHGVAILQIYNFGWVFDLKPNFILAPIVTYESDILRPADFDGLPNNHKYIQHGLGFVAKGTPFNRLTFNAKIFRQGTVLIDVPTGHLPITGNETVVNVTITFKPARRLQIDNTYILDRVLNGAVRQSAFNNHIIRSKWNYQFTPALSFRVIAQYNGLLANPRSEFSN